MAKRDPNAFKFNEAVLQNLVEPLTVRLVKSKGGVTIPIQLPLKEGFSSGEGFERQDIRELESFVLNEWSGGGYYTCTVTDQDGQGFTWKFDYPPQTYPEKIPPNQQNAASASAVANAAAQRLPAAQLNTAPPADNGSEWMYQAAAAYGPPSAQVMPPLNPAPRGVPMLQTPVVAPVVAAVNNQAEERARVLEQQLEAERRSRLEAEYQARIQKERDEHARQLADLKREMEMENAKRIREAEEAKRLREEEEGSKQSALEQQLAQLRQEMRNQLVALRDSKAGQDSEAMEQIRLLREEQKIERERWEAEKREERHRQEMQAMNDKFEKLLLAQNSNKVDPMVEFLKENARQQAEAQKEAARMQQAQIESMRNFTMTPAQLMTIVRDSSSSAEILNKNVTMAFTDILKMQQQAAATMLELQSGQGESTGMAVFNGLKEQLGEVAQVYMQNQRDVGVAQAKAQAEAAKTQAEALRAQARMIEMQAHQQVAAAESLPEAPAPVQQVQAPQAVQQAQVQHGVNLGEPSELDVKRFGVAASSVLQLRYQVAQGKFTPVTAAQAFMQGLAMAQAQNLLPQIPAFNLVEAGRVSELVEILVPQAPAAFKREFVHAIDMKLRASTQVAGFDDEDSEEEVEDEGDDDVEGDEEDEHNGISAKPAHVGNNPTVESSVQA